MRKLGINFNPSPTVPAGEILRSIRAAGFDSTFTDYFDDRTVGQYAEEAAKAGLAIETLHSAYGHMNAMWHPGNEGDATLRSLIDCADICAHWGIPTMIVHVSNGVTPPPVNDVGHARFDRFVGHAARLGVTVAFENIWTLSNLAFMFETYRDYENVGFCWDCGHESCFAHGMQYMPLFGKKTVALHLHDNSGEFRNDEHKMPFDAKIDFNRVTRQIRESGYAGTLMLEITNASRDKNYGGLSYDEFHALAFERAKKLRDMTDGEV